MKAMVLAAGKGKRLKPLTLKRAKPAIPVFNIPMIVRTLNFLFKYGIDEAIVNVHYIPESIKRAVMEKFNDEAKVTFSFEENLLGTAGGLKNVEEYFRDETFVMINSDTLLEFNLKEMIGFHKDRSAVSTMLLSHSQGKDNFGKVSLAEDNRIVDILGSLNSTLPSSPMNFAGVHIMEPEVLDFIPAGKVSEINSDIYPEIIRSRKSVMGYINRGIWHDIGTLERYMEIQTGHDTEIMNALNISKDKNGNCISGENTFIDENAEVLYSVIGKGCKIAKGSRIIKSVILENVNVQENAVIENTIVDSDTTVTRGLIYTLDKS